MPWDPNALAAAKAGLREAAADGRFVPYIWRDEDPDGGHRIFGCGWGIIAHSIAVMLGGAAWADKVVPKDCDQRRVNQVLMAVGLTETEISAMTPSRTWKRFDRELAPVYNNRNQNWMSFITMSLILVEFFVKALDRVAVKKKQDEVPRLPATASTERKFARAA